MQNQVVVFFVCFLSEQERLVIGGGICTVLLTNLVKPPNESCETGAEEATSGGHFLIVVDVVSDDIIMTGFG